MLFARPFQRFAARTLKGCPGIILGIVSGENGKAGRRFPKKGARRFDMSKESLVGVACGRFFVLMGMSRLAARAMVECQYVLCMV